MKKLNLFLTSLALLISITSNAGAVKEVLMEHTDGIESEVAAMKDFSIVRIFNTRFVQASTGFEIAIESQVEVAQDGQSEIFEIACTSYFNKDLNNNYNLTTTNCEYPE